MTLRRIIFFSCLGFLIVVLSACDETTKQMPVTPTVKASDTPVVNNDIPISTTTPVENFSISTANQTLPEDVLKEILYSLGGGPGNRLECIACVLPEFHQDSIWTCVDDNEIVLGEYLEICVFSQQPDELIKMTLTFPDNKKILHEEKKTTTRGNLSAYFSYLTQMSDPSGYYTFTLEGHNSIVQHSVLVTIVPCVYFNMQDKTISLYHFKPNEHIRLFAYEPHKDIWEFGTYGYGILKAWQEYQVDDKGQIIIEVDNTYDFVVIGDISGNVDDDIHRFFIETDLDNKDIVIYENPTSEANIVEYVSSGTLIPVIGERLEWLLIRLENGTEGWVKRSEVKKVEEIIEDGGSSSCPGAPPQHIKVGGTAKVCTLRDRLIVLEQPKRGSTQVTRLDPETQVKVIDGPVCADDWSWWKIETNSGVIGWVSEGGDEIDPYFICPVEDEAAGGGENVGCPGAPPQRVHIGENASVCTRQDKLIVLEKPERGTTQLARLDPGTQIKIIDGPECADGWSWWKIETDSGIIGWVSEGGDEIDPYFICPAE